MLPILFAFLLQTYTPLSAVPNCAAFGVPVTGGGYDAAFTEYVVGAAGVDAILSLDTSRSFWLGYDSGGFAAAYFDSDPALTLTLTTADGGERWIDITVADGVYYVLPYAMTTAYADANGEHYGTHPCAAFTITGDEFARLLAALEAT